MLMAVLSNPAQTVSDHVAHINKIPSFNAPSVEHEEYSSQEE